MTVTSLVENTVFDENLKAEHGLSLYIETETHKILFDMGQTELFFENAVKLGIDLADVDIAVLSHGHYDHGGGLKKFLRINKKAPIFLREDAFVPHFNGTEKYIGLDESLRENDRLIFTSDKTEIDSNLTLFSCNERNFVFSFRGLNMIKNKELLPDDFHHEQYLLIEEDGKKVLISGCSHKGILNIVDYFRPNVLIGGFHMSKLSLDKTLSEYGKQLDSYESVFYTCHCTGEEQYEFLKEKMKNLHYLSTGQTITI